MDISGIAGLPYNLKDVILSNIGATFFADYAIIDSVNSDKTINVVHATIPVLINGTVLPKTQTNNIEVLYPASAAFGMNWQLVKGDGVLLVGLKDYVDSTNGIVEPTEAPNVFMHYVQNTMKAIPLQSVTAPKVTINVVGSDLEINNMNTGGLIKIANASKSLRTLLDTLIGHVRDLTTTNCVSGAPVALSPETIALLNTDIANFDLLLKA